MFGTNNLTSFPPPTTRFIGSFVASADTASGWWIRARRFMSIAAEVPWRGESSAARVSILVQAEAPFADEGLAARLESRLKVSLVAHVAKKRSEYLTEKLYRIGVEPIEYGSMPNYAFKTFRKGRVSAGDILVLN